MNKSNKQFVRPEVKVGDIHYAYHNSEFHETKVWKVTKTQFYFSNGSLSSTTGTDKHYYRPKPQFNDYELAPKDDAPLF